VYGSVDPDINYSMSYAEWDAVTSLGLDLWLWETGFYPKKFRAKALAFYKLRKLIEIHSQDAVAKEERKRTSQHKKGRGR
jgi:hypothetical protein